MKAKDEGPEALASYDAAMNASETMKVLKRRRNMRLAFKSGFYFGGFKAAAHDRDGRRLPRLEDLDASRRRGASPPGSPRPGDATTAS